MKNNFSVDWVGLYINCASTSLFIILGKFPSLNLATFKKPPFIKVAIISDVILVSNFDGCKGKAITLLAHYFIDIYKTVARAIIFRKIINHTKYKVIFIFSD